MCELEILEERWLLITDKAPRQDHLEHTLGCVVMRLRASVHTVPMLRLNNGLELPG